MNRKTKKRTRSVMLGKHVLKLISIILAALLWFYVLNSEPQIVERDVRVIYNPPAGFAVANLAVREITVKVKGSRSFLRELYKNNEKVYIDLKSYPYRSKTSFYVNISPADIAVPFGVDVVSVTPSKIKVALEKEITKKVRVRANLVGDVSSELKLINYKVVPSSVYIIGPIEVMRKIGQIKTLPIDQSSLKGEGEQKIGISDVDQRIIIKRDSPLTFKYNVRPRKANLTLKRIPVRFLSSKNVHSKTKYVALDVLAPEGVKIKSSQVQVIADIKTNIKGRVKIKLEAKLPEGVHLLQVHPEYIWVRVR